MGVCVFEGHQVFKYLLVRLSKEKKNALVSTAALALLYEGAFDSTLQDVRLICCMFRDPWESCLETGEFPRDFVNA